MIFKRLKRSSNAETRGSPSGDEPYLLLYEASRRLGSHGGLKESLEAALSTLQHRYKLSACLLFLSSDEGPLNLGYFAGISAELARALLVRPGEGVLGVAFSSGRARLVEDMAQEISDPFVREMIQRHSVQSALFVPLAAEGRVLGVAAFLARTRQVFENSVVESFTRFADHASLVLRNARQLELLQSSNHHLETAVASTVEELSKTNERLIRKVSELKTVYELALNTAASSTVEEVLRIIIGGIQELMEVQSGAFFRFSVESRRLDPVEPAFGRPAGGTAALGCRLEESTLLRRVVEERTPLILNFVEPGESLPASWKDLSIRSILALPLEQNGDIKGIFCVANKVSGLFVPEDVRLLSLLTGRVTEVLRRLELDQQLRQRVGDLSLLQEISAELPSVPVLTDTVAAIGRVVRKQLADTDLCLFFVHHVPSEALVMMGGDWNEALTFDTRTLTAGTSEKVPVADVFRESRPAYYEKGASPDFWERDVLVNAFGLEQLVYLPLSVEHEHIGVLALGTRKAQGLTFDHRRLAGLIAQQVAIVIERSRLYEKLRSANEKLEQINTLKNEFISMVSHELRTPLTTIKGFVSIVLNEETGPLNDQQRRFLETSDRAIDRLTLLVSDLLDISRIEAGQIKMQLRPISVRDMVSRVAASFAPQLKTQNLSFTANIPENLPAVLADPDRVGQVFDNLLTNSLKFTTKGGITITAVDKGDFVMISVKDTGTGIVREEQDKIFEKFYQIKTGHSWPSKGTGLGLAIVRSIVESHRGKVWVESDPGKGADFRFILPRARPEATSEQKPAS